MNMERKVKQIVIDCRSMINYASYYLQGLKMLGLKYHFIFIDEISLHEMQDYRRGMAMIIEYEDESHRKIYIDTADGNNVHERFYGWADVYAKINLKAEDLSRGKVVAIGPSFGIQVWNPFTTMCKCVSNFLKCKKDQYHVPFKIFMRDYLYTFIRRKPYETYHSVCNEDRDYIFTLSTLWYNQDAYIRTNPLRGAFARICKEIYPRFEGGFYYIEGEAVLKECPQYLKYQQEYGDMIIKKRITMTEYQDKIKRSSIVFNIPSVLGCHGWKMGEYLAMGKAMISMPLNNVMPGEFKSGGHFLEVQSPEEIKDAVVRLKNHPEDIERLKEKSSKYFKENLAPDVVMKKLLEV